MKDELIEILKNLKAVYKTPETDPDILEVDVDVKRLYGYPPFLRLLCTGVYEQAMEMAEKSGKRVTCVASAGYSGVPLATGISLQYNLKQTMVRSHPSEGAASEWFEGHIPTDEDVVLIVEDTFSKGRSLSHIIDVLKETGAEVLGYHVVVRRRKGEHESGIPVHSLLHAEELEHLV